MSEKTPSELWSEFVAAWPLERVREMTIEEYTNPNKDDAFIYWIECHLQTLGSIWGGSAFKFGVYCRDNTDMKETAAGRAWSDKYAWATKYGATAEEAFVVVKSRLTEVAEAAAAGNFARVEEIDLAPVLKWKVAFLYQDREQPSIFPIFKKQALFANYTAIDPRAKLSATPYYVMYETLLERHRSMGNVFKIERTLWEHYQSGKKRKSRAWAVPLSWVLVPLAVDQAAVRCSYGHENVGSSAVPGSLRWTITGMRTTATKQRRERPRAVKMSLQFSRVLTTPACIAGVLVSRPNFNALCGRPKL